MGYHGSEKGILKWKDFDSGVSAAGTESNCREEIARVCGGRGSV